MVSMNEKVSALIDGELPDADAARVLEWMGEDPEHCRQWDTCHLIGDALRGHLSPQVATKVSRRLAAEPTTLSPRRRKSLVPRGNALRVMQAAASVAAIALVAWMALPILQGGMQSEIAQAPAPAASEVQNYLLAHQRYSPSNAMQGVAPYVRLVATESSGGGK